MEKNEAKGTISRMRKSFTYNLEGETLNIESASVTYSTDDGRIESFSGRITNKDKAYEGDFSYQDPTESRKMNISVNVDCLTLSNAVQLVLLAVDDIKSQVEVE